MTIGEIIRAADGINWRHENERKEKAYFDYTLAILITKGISKLLGDNKDFPEIEDAYPDIYQLTEEEVIKRKTQKSVKNFLNFANNFNANFKKGEVN